MEYVDVAHLLGRGIIFLPRCNRLLGVLDNIFMDLNAIMDGPGSEDRGCNAS